MKNIIGRESVHNQCYECTNCEPPKIETGGSRFHCAFLNKEFGTWHYDIPTECPCSGRGWKPKKGANDEQ
jgi:hypothetical protein